MIIYALMLTIGLDMTLPEFQPEKDLSGNYIVGTYDVSSGDVYVEILDDVPVDENSSVDDSLSTSPVRIETSSISENDDVVTAIQSLQDDNNAYWELFLDSYPIEINHSLGSSQLSNQSWFINTDSTVGVNNGNYRICYVPVLSGINYTISNIAVPSYNRYSYFVVDDLSNPTSVTNKGTLNPLTDPFSVTPSQDGYFCLQINYGNAFGSFVSDWITVERESYTLSELGNAVVEIRSNNDIKFRVLIFLTLINLVYPIVCSISKNIIGGDK